MDTKKLLKLVSQIDKHKARIAKERDAVRVISDELNDLLESFDTGIEALESGAREITDGVDNLSQLV